MSKKSSASKSEREDAAATSASENNERHPSIAGLDAQMSLALQAASDKKAFDVVALDLREVANFTDCFLIASGANARQAQAIADAIEERLKMAGMRPARIEGYRTAEWILLDYGDFIFHVFEDKARRFYDLERLWRDARFVELPSDIANAQTEEEGGARRKRM